jgi:hypothetical protein
MPAVPGELVAARRDGRPRRRQLLGAFNAERAPFVHFSGETA